MSKGKSDETIMRFSLTSRLGHGIHALSFVLLFITGCALVFRGFGSLLGPDGLRLFSSIHHFFGIVFTFVPIFILVFLSWKHTKRWLHDIFHWSNEDVKFVMVFPKVFFGFKAKTPKQGRFNGGEKINSILQIAGCFVLIITGWIMLMGSASPEALGWARVIHSVTALVLGGVILAHAFLGLLHPGSKESIKGMLGGNVSKKWARDHHALWVEEVEGTTTGQVSKSSRGGVING